jgi:UPF0755 protein
MTAFVLAVVLVVGYAGYRMYENRYHPKDYAGQGTGSVLISVRSGDAAGDIAQTLVDKGVVRTKRAFTNAAGANSNSGSISAGTYKLHKHMSAASALAMMLDSTSRVSNNVVVFEGATVIDVAKPLAKALNVDVATATAAIDKVSTLGLPSGYTRGSASPTSVEGFLYPATYTFDPGISPANALQEMIAKFIEEDRSSGFEGRRRLPQGRAGDPQPDRRQDAVADRRDQRLRREAAQPRPDEGHLREDRLAVQHVHA